MHGCSVQGAARHLQIELPQENRKVHQQLTLQQLVQQPLVLQQHVRQLVLEAPVHTRNPKVTIRTRVTGWDMGAGWGSRPLVIQQVLKRTQAHRPRGRCRGADQHRRADPVTAQDEDRRCWPDARHTHDTHTTIHDNTRHTRNPRCTQYSLSIHTHDILDIVYDETPHARHRMHLIMTRGNEGAPP